MPHDHPTMMMARLGDQLCHGEFEEAAETAQRLRGLGLDVRCQLLPSYRVRVRQSVARRPSAAR